MVLTPATENSAIQKFIVTAQMRKKPLYREDLASETDEVTYTYIYGGTNPVTGTYLYTWSNESDDSSSGTAPRIVEMSSGAFCIV